MLLSPFFIFLLALLSVFKMVECQIGCQYSATEGRDYRGTANTTKTGIPCQKWSDTQPHNHSFTHVGDHNFCRNPDGMDDQRVWCFTADPNIEWDFCSVPFCPPMNGLGCQNRSTSGGDYLGTANKTVTGIPCQTWSDTEPHDHRFTLHTLVITTTVGTLLGVALIKCGAMPIAVTLNGSFAQFPFAILCQMTSAVSTSLHLAETTKEQSTLQ